MLFSGTNNMLVLQLRLNALPLNVTGTNTVRLSRAMFRLAAIAKSFHPYSKSWYFPQIEVARVAVAGCSGAAAARPPVVLRRGQAKRLGGTVLLQENREGMRSLMRGVWGAPVHIRL